MALFQRDGVLPSSGERIGSTAKALVWMVEHAGPLISRYNVQDDGKTSYERLKGNASHMLGIEFGENVWWKRRPAGGLGAPRPPRDWRAPRAVLVIGAVCCALFPLTGLSLLAVLAIDFALPSGLRARVA